MKKLLRFECMEPRRLLAYISDIQNQVTNEDFATSAISFTVGDATVPLNQLTVSGRSSNSSLVQDSNIVFGGSGANRTVVVTPLLNQFGTTTITVSISNGTETATDTFLLTVNSVNDLPTITPSGANPIGNIVMDADGSVTLNYSVADVETSVSSLVSSAVVLSGNSIFPTVGTSASSSVRLQSTTANRTIRLRPVGDAYGHATIQLQLADNQGGTSTFLFDVNVQPRAVNDNLLAIAGRSSTLNVLANDTPATLGSQIRITNVSPPLHGAIEIIENGQSLRYTPTIGYVGPDLFTYTSTEQTSGHQMTATVYLTVDNRLVNSSVHSDFRLLFEDGEWFNEAGTDFQFGSPVQGGSANPTVSDWDELLIHANSSSAFVLPTTLNAGQYSFIGESLGSSIWMLTQSQTPGVAWPGISTEDISTTTFESYTPIGDPRATTNARWIRLEMVGARMPANANFSAFQSDFLGPKVFWDTFDGISQSESLTHGNNVSDAFWTTPGSHAHLNFAFTKAGRYEIDVVAKAIVMVGGVLTEVASPINTIYFDVDTIQATPLSEAPPTARNDSASTNEDSAAIEIDVLANDSPSPDRNEALRILSVTSSGNATIAIVNDVQSITYLPNPNYSGSDSFEYMITDEHGGTTTATVTVDVDAVNDAPTISGITDRFVVEGGSTGSIPFSISDIETASGSLVVTATSSNQAVIPNGNIVLGGSGANRTIAIPSILDQVGSTTITVTVTDAGGAQTSNTFVLTVGDLVRATFDRSSVIVNATQPLDVRMVDIDNDGDLDVLFSKYITSISILLNNGNGTFGTEIALSALTVSDFHIADVNGDNRPDIVSSVYVDSTYEETAIAVWRNLGAGTFSERELVESTRTTGFVALTGVGDLDGDGLKDFVLNVSGLSWSRNLGSGTFGVPTIISTGGINYSSVLQDIDQDGDLDIAQAILLNNVFKLQVLRNSGTGVPNFIGEDIALFGSSVIRSIAVGDTNQDGFVDIHLLRGDSNRDIVALHGTSTGTFVAPVVLGSGLNLTDLKLGDIDGDGRPDMALTSREQNKVHFVQNLGNGVFTELQEFTHDGSSINASPEAVAIGDIDGDGRNDLVFSERFGTGIAWSRNRSEENITTLTPPEPRTYLNGYPMTFDVFLGFHVNLNTLGGSPTLPVTIGSQVIQVPFVGQPNANTLRFRYQVQSTDVDLDGIQVANSVVLNGATVTDIHDRPLDAALVEFASVDTTGILVNGGAPYIAGIMRLDATPASTSSVRFAVTFSESVTGVAIDDFRLDANGPTGAAIMSVTGSGNSYVVTANIGSGDGTLKLRVLDDDSIADANSHPLGGVGLGNGEFAFGQGYTVRSSTATPVFNNVIRDGHLDVSLLLYEGEWYPYWNGVGFWDTTDTVLSTGPDARAIRPADPKWDFLGAAVGENIWIFPESFSATTPWPGVGAYDNPAGVFASYFESDPRVNATAAWLKMSLLDVRGPEGGEFSLYQGGIADPIVFMSTANGIGAEDTAWIPNLDHIHYNWAFTKPGFYQVDVVASGYIDFNQSGTYEPGVDPLSESQIITLHFAVELSAQDDVFTVAGRETLRGSVTLNDQSEWGIAASTTTIQSATSHGTLVLQANGSFTYHPSATFDGSDYFTYRLNNPNGGFTTATAFITGSTRPAFDEVLTSGHSDIGVNFADGDWDLHVHDEEGDAEYESDEALLYVSHTARTSRAGDLAQPAYDFLGTASGGTIYVLPEIENAELLFLGLGTEELVSGIFAADTVKLRLAAVSGPGQFSMWRTGIGPVVAENVIATADGITGADQIVLSAGAHLHTNFAFTERGLYQVTFVAEGVLEEVGSLTQSRTFNYYFQVGNQVLSMDIQDGQTQRSFVAKVDIALAANADLDDLLLPGRVRLTQYDLNGLHGFDVLDPARRPSMQVNGSQLSMNWGVHGIGGNRSSSLGDGYYRVSVDLDGDGQFDSHHYFYRLFGDSNGDGRVTSSDVSLVQSQLGQRNSEADVDGNGVVNAIDRLHAQRGLGRQLLDSLWLDD